MRISQPPRISIDYRKGALTVKIMAEIEKGLA
jgi:hypothetical protein